MSTLTPPDPATEIRITTLHATRGFNYWSRRPVIRMDLTVGAFDEISSAQIPGMADALLRAMPGLIEHRCSIGSRGGFMLRVRRGTYVPHIIEHVALELQVMVGHDVGYGRTRPAANPPGYTLIFEHRHEQVGLRAAALALETVQRAFAGTLDTVDPAIRELAALAKTPDAPPIHQNVFCGVIGGTARAETQHELSLRLGRREPQSLIVDVSPAYLLTAGLPYSRSDLAIILDAELGDVPDPYREADRARRLVSTLADAVRRDGFVVCPAKEWEIQDYARERDCRVAVFATDSNVTLRDTRVAEATALVRESRIWLERCGGPDDGGPLRDDIPPVAQVAAALAEYVFRAGGTEARCEPAA